MGEVMKVRALAVPGTNESHVQDGRELMPPPNESMLSFVTQHLNPDLFATSRWVGYPADYGNDMPYEDSVTIGVENLHEIAMHYLDVGERLVVLGYSQGGTIVRRWLALIAVGAFGPPSRFAGRVLGAGLVADPYRPAGFALDYDPGGYGLAGVEEIWADAWLLEMAAHRDPICSAPMDCLLRDVADFTGYMSVNPAHLEQWMRDIVWKVTRGNWQNFGMSLAEIIRTADRIHQALDLAAGYLPRLDQRRWVVNPGGGRHTCYGVELMPGSPLTYCQRLAEELNARVAAL